MSISGAGLLQMVDVWALKQVLSASQAQVAANPVAAVVNQLDAVNTAIAQNLTNLGQNLDISI